jgi:hypothetical protein
MSKVTEQKLNESMGKMLEQCCCMLVKKGADYGNNNFILSAQIASIITGKSLDAVDAAAILVGMKLARIGELMGKNKEPMNESLNDSFMDVINYIVLMDRERKRRML